MHAEAEREQLVGVGSRDVEPHRVGEHVLVAVRRRVGRQHDVSGGDRHTTELVILLRPAEEAANRAGPADDLLGRVDGQRRVGLPGGELVGVTEELFETSRRRERRGVVAGRRHDDVVPEPLDLPEGRSVDLAVGDHGGEVIGGVGAAGGGQLVEVRLERVDRVGDERERVGEVAQVLGVGGTEQALRELQHQRLVLAGNTEDAHDHPEREGHGDVGGEVASPTHLRHLLDELVRDLVDGRLQALDRCGLEPVVGDLAVLLVDVAVEVHDRSRQLDTESLQHVVLEVGARRRLLGVEEDVAAP